MFGAGNIQPMKSSTADPSEKNIQSGVDKTKKSSGSATTTGTGDSNSSIENNEFPEASIDEMRAQMELVLSRYIQEAERRDAMRAKMSESDAQTLLSDATSAGGGSGSGSTQDEYDSKAAYDDNRKSRSSNSKSSSSSSSTGDKVKKSHK